MAFAKTFLARLKAVEQFICFSAFMVMGGALIYDVLKREMTGSGAFGAPQVGVVGMIVASYIGIGLASAAGAHYRPRFADRLLPARYDALLNRLSDFGFALFCTFVAVVAANVTQESFNLAETNAVLHYPVWPVQITLVIGFTLVALRHFIYGIYPALRPATVTEGTSELASMRQADEIMHAADNRDGDAR